MEVSKSVAFFLLVGVVGMLSGGSIQAQNAPHNADSAQAPLPKDVYPDSRNRLPMPKREGMSDENKKIFDEVPGGKPLANGRFPPGFLPAGTPETPGLPWAPNSPKSCRKSLTIASMKSD